MEIQTPSLRPLSKTLTASDKSCETTVQICDGNECSLHGQVASYNFNKHTEKYTFQRQKIELENDAREMPNDYIPSITTEEPEFTETTSSTRPTTPPTTPTITPSTTTPVTTTPTTTSPTNTTPTTTSTTTPTSAPEPPPAEL